MSTRAFLFIWLMASAALFTLYGLVIAIFSSLPHPDYRNLFAVVVVVLAGLVTALNWRRRARLYAQERAAWDAYTGRTPASGKAK